MPPPDSAHPPASTVTPNPNPRRIPEATLPAATSSLPRGSGLPTAGTAPSSPCSSTNLSQLAQAGSCRSVARWPSTYEMSRAQWFGPRPQLGSPKSPTSARSRLALRGCPPPCLPQAAPSFGQPRPTSGLGSASPGACAREGHYCSTGSSTTSPRRARVRATLRRRGSARNARVRVRARARARARARVRVSGQWSVVSGQWSVVRVSGQWSVVSGQWSVVSGQG